MEYIDALNQISEDFGETFISEALRHYSSALQRGEAVAPTPQLEPHFAKIAEKYLAWEDDYLAAEINELTVGNLGTPSVAGISNPFSQSSPSNTFHVKTMVKMEHKQMDKTIDQYFKDNG